MEQEILEIYNKAFPGVTPSCFQQDLLFTTVTDLGRWRRTITFWAGNDYRPQSIAKMLEYYQSLQGDTVGKYDPALEINHVPEPACGVCGKDPCFSLHREN